MKRLSSFVSLSVAAALLLGGCSFRSGPRGVQPEELTPAQWAALSKPGESHKLLDAFAGSWDVRIRFWSSPSAAPQDSHGTSTLSWILGDRFLQEDFQGDVLGEAYQGLGLMGYDAAARRFMTVWLDSLNTVIAMQQGSYSPDKGTFELRGEVYDPLIGRNKTTRSEIRILSPNEYSVSMIDMAPNGADFKSLEIVYTRRGEGVPLATASLGVDVKKRAD